MEYTQWADPETFLSFSEIVLILVVMEYTQWVFGKVYVSPVRSLNPCCNGIYSMSV